MHGALVTANAPVVGWLVGWLITQVNCGHVSGQFMMKFGT